MDNDELNRWAADFIGEDDPDEAVEAESYTGNPGAAFLVLAKCAEEGCAVSISIDKGKATVKCDEHEESGDFDDLGRVIVEACQGCMGDGLDT